MRSAAGKSRGCGKLADGGGGLLAMGGEPLREPGGGDHRQAHHRHSLNLNTP